MPNCRAIRDGVMPALKAARTALICPRGSETVAKSACCLFLADERFDTGSSGVFACTLGGGLPRRFASSSDAVISRSSSRSVRYLTALGRCLGRTWRCFCADEPCFAVDEVFSPRRCRREQIGCCWLSAVTPHAVIMPAAMPAGNIGRQLGGAALVCGGSGLEGRSAPGIRGHPEAAGP